MYSRRDMGRLVLAGGAVAVLTGCGSDNAGGEAASSTSGSDGIGCGSDSGGVEGRQ